MMHLTVCVCVCMCVGPGSMFYGFCFYIVMYRVTCVGFDLCVWYIKIVMDTMSALSVH